MLWTIVLIVDVASAASSYVYYDGYAHGSGGGSAAGRVLLSLVSSIIVVGALAMLVPQLAITVRAAA